MTIEWHYVYDNNTDDSEDNLVFDRSDLSVTSCTVKHDKAGNLIDDCHFRYVYDAWHRLVKVQTSVDGGACAF